MIRGRMELVQQSWGSGLELAKGACGTKLVAWSAEQASDPSTVLDAFIKAKPMNTDTYR